MLLQGSGAAKQVKLAKTVDIRAKRRPRGRRDPTPSVHLTPSGLTQAPSEELGFLSLFRTRLVSSRRLSTGCPLLFRKASDVSPGAKPRPLLSFVSLLPGGDGVAPVAILCQTLPQSVEGSFQSVKKDTKWHSRASRWRGTNRRRRPNPVQSVKYPRYCEEKTV